MRKILLFCALLCAGCSSMDDGAEHRLLEAKQIADTRPDEALQLLDPVLAKYPKEGQVHRVRANALRALGRKAEAAEAWRAAIRAHGSLSSKQLIEAHQQYAKLAEELLGDLPHALPTSVTNEERASIDSLMASLDFLVDEFPDHVYHQIQRAACFYRLGNKQGAERALSKMRKQGGDDPSAAYLRCLLLETDGGYSADALRTEFELLRNTSGGLQEQIVKHLIHLHSSSALPELEVQNVLGILQRFLREPGEKPAALLAWEQSYSGAEKQRLSTRMYDREMAEIRTALNQQRCEDAWRKVQELPPTNPQVAEMRAEIASRWMKSLVTSGGAAMAEKNFTESRRIIAELQRVPRSDVPEPLLQEAQNLVDAMRKMEGEFTAKVRLERAREALKMRNPQEAFTNLDGLEEIISDDLRSEMYLLRARALLAWGDRKGALQAFDQAKNPKEIADKRNYAVLLVEAGRADEALPYLDLLPLGAMRGEALDALLSTLERQGNWESILSRLSDLNPLPKRYQALQVKALGEAANRWLRGGDATRALRVLESFQQVEMLRKPPLLETYLLTVLRANDLKAARATLLAIPDTALATLTAPLLIECAEKLGPQIEDRHRYRLLQQAYRKSPNTELQQEIADLAPQVGNYLPAPGNYMANFELTTPGSEEGVDKKTKVSATLTFRDGRFQFTEAGASAQKMWIRDGIMHLSTDQGEILMPALIKDPAQLPGVDYTYNNELWTAQVEEAGSSVTIGASTYDGCLTVKLSKGDDTAEVVRIVIAPETGIVRREILHGGQLAERHELLELIPVTE